jgi:hypothetical protein
MLAAPLAAVLTSVALALPVVGTHTNTSDAASRQSVRHGILLRDGPGDVWKFNGDSWVSVGAVPKADILRFRAVHGRTDLTCVMTFDNLRKTHLKVFSVSVSTPKLRRVAYVQASPGHPRGAHGLTNVRGDNLPSRGMTHQVRYVRDTVTIVVPRALLGKPRWVRVEAENIEWLPPAENDSLLEDNPSTHKPLRGWFSNLTARLYRS